jgi:hypothetical protein
MERERVAKQTRTFRTYASVLQALAPATTAFDLPDPFVNVDPDEGSDDVDEPLKGRCTPAPSYFQSRHRDGLRQILDSSQELPLVLGDSGAALLASLVMSGLPDRADAVKPGEVTVAIYGSRSYQVIRTLHPAGARFCSTAERPLYMALSACETALGVLTVIDRPRQILEEVRSLLVPSA